MTGYGWYTGTGTFCLIVVKVFVFVETPTADEPPKTVDEPPKTAGEPPKTVDEPPKTAEASPKTAEESPKTAEGPDTIDVDGIPLDIIEGDDWIDPGKPKPKAPWLRDRFSCFDDSTFFCIVLSAVTQ